MGGKPNRKESYGFINLIAVVACFAVIVIILSVMFAKFIIDRSSEISVPDESSDAGISRTTEESGDESFTPSASETSHETSEPELSAEVSEEEPYRIIMLEEEDIHKGTLVVVNSETPFDFSHAPVTVNIYKTRTQKTFGFSDTNLFISQNVMTPLQEMLNALAAYAGSNALTLTSAYRSEEAQKKLYDAGKDGDAPGESDLHTGLSFKCTVYPSSSGKLGEGKFQWLDENCMFYGFIRRYPEGKKSLTGHDAVKSLFRYVGVPHAYLIYVNNYCLEEYVDFCRRFSYESKYLTTCDGIDYAIYYVPVNRQGVTQIKIPENVEYTVSGDNSGGFIVTLTLGSASPTGE